jgi:hypothetical protein
MLGGLRASDGRVGVGDGGERAERREIPHQVLTPIAGADDGNAGPRR